MKLLTLTLLLLGCLVTSFSLADTLGTGKSLRDIRHANNSVMDDVYAISSPVTTTTLSTAVSWDPFALKTNKYAESRLIRVLCKTKGCNIRMGASTIGAAVTTDYELIADKPEYFGIDTAYPYVRIIENAATSVMQVTEIY